MAGAWEGLNVNQEIFVVTMRIRILLYLGTIIFRIQTTITARKCPDGMLWFNRSGTSRIGANVVDGCFLLGYKNVNIKCMIPQAQSSRGAK